MNGREQKTTRCVIPANTLVAGERYRLEPDGPVLAEQLGPWQTVPWLPEACGEQIKGRTLRALRLAAQLAIEAGWSAATLEARPGWNEPTLPGALVRTAVRLGMIP